MYENIVQNTTQLLLEKIAQQKDSYSMKYLKMKINDKCIKNQLKKIEKITHQKKDIKNQLIIYIMFDLKKFTLTEGKLLHGNYFIDSELGGGSFGKVYKAYKKDTKEVVAIKQIPKEGLNANPKLQQLYNSEVSLLKILSSENIIKYIDNFNTTDCCYIVTEYCNQGDLGTLLVKHKRFPEQRVISYFKQLLNGFKDLHKHQVIHRDIKPENILINQKTLKIADLGFAKSITGTTQTCLGTYTTMAPEVLEQKPYGLEADVFSLGVMLYKLLYGVYPYRSDTGNLRYVIKERIRQIKYDVSDGIISDVMQDLLKRMICYDRRDRITWDQIYQHPILQMDSFGVSLLLPAGSVILMPNNNQEAIDLYKKFKHLMVTDSDCEIKEMQPGFSVNQEFNVADDKESSNGTNHRSEFEAFKQMDKELERKESIFDCIQDASLKYNHYRQLYVSIFQILKHICKIPKEFRNKIIQFALSKKAYNLTFKMEQALSRDQNIFNIKYFEEFKKDENYKNIRNQMLGNVNDFCVLFQSAKRDVQQVLLSLQQEQQQKSVLIDLLQKELETDQITEKYESLIKAGLCYDYHKLYNQLENSKNFDVQTKCIMLQYYIFARDMINQDKKFGQIEFNFAGYFNSIQQYNLEESNNQFKAIVDELGLQKIKI
ncbi:Serine/Threonine kinase domain protein (macronuclear) [Tetrahymena thermophila SB210]|uniref:Serine/Threonine kinase domain protein n=1 Tax=Tetrahymena thermophila (strain SB210) TaxID=312017 RepID=I7LY19_TETTS|nr:Serine/Threonine kinase domain protein [Tetrahymena thermophila SB210]EAS07197.2 Serine/Threonine kinase domain protein [Tetrahymena thermophila SB210]|eukprot:XP_001027439.2 Serine/Threonine kinase domain protein [Tetrahymena thermophila SB210]